MKFITQGETPVIEANDIREIVETDAQGNELATLPAASTNPLPIIWITDAVSTETIAAMMATGKYVIRVYADIEKDAADIQGYRKPLFLIPNVFLSLPDTDERTVTYIDDPNDIDIPIAFLEARDLCQETFDYTPLKDSKEYDLDYHLLGIKSPPYNPSSPSPSPVPIPAPIISIPIPPSKGKAKAIEAKKQTPPLSPKKDFGDICPKCRRPYKYDHVAWARNQTDGYTCRCKKDNVPPPSPPLVPLAPRPRTPSPKTTASEQANPTQTMTERPLTYVNYDQFNRWVRDHTNYQCLRDTLYYDDEINAKLSDWKRLDNMEAHLDEMKGRLDTAWDALDSAQFKLGQAKEDVRKTVHDFPLAYRGIIREKKRVFDNLKGQGIEKKASAFFRESAQDEEETKEKKRQRKRSDTHHLPSYPRNPHRPIAISSSSSSGIEVPIRSRPTPTIDSQGWDRQFATVGARFIPAPNLSPEVTRTTCHQCQKSGHVRKDCEQYKCRFCNRHKPNHSPYHCPYNQDGPKYEGPPDDEPYGDDDGLYGDGEQ